MSYSSKPQVTNNSPDFVMPQFENESNFAMSFWKRNRVLMTSTAIGILIPSLLYTFFVFEPKFSTSATVLVKDSAIKAKYVSIDEFQTTSSPAANPVLNTVELLRNPAIRDNLWNRLISPNKKTISNGRFKTYHDWVKFFGDGSKVVKYNNPPGTDVIQLKMDWNDPHVAQDILGNVIISFQEASRDLNRQEHQERYHYMQEHIVTVKNQLAALRQKISDIKAHHGVVSIDEEISNYAKYHMEFKMAAALAKAESLQNTQRLAAYQSSMGMSARNAVKAVGIGLNHNLQDLNESLYKQNEQLSTLSARYTDENPKIIELKQSIEQTKADIASESKRMGIEGGGPIIADESRGKSLNEMLDVNSQAQGSQRRSAQLGKELNRVESRMNELPRIENNLKQLSDQELSLSTSLKSLEEKALDEQIREEQTISNVFVIKPPELPTSPGAPTRNHMLILSFLVSLLGAVLAVRIKSQFNKVKPSLEQRFSQNGHIMKHEDELLRV
jgi:uncharacterized protein involved in exopolysaccharide biosynthesis